MHNSTTIAFTNGSTITITVSGDRYAHSTFWYSRAGNEYRSPPRSKKEKQLQALLEEFDGNTKKLEFKLRTAEIERKASSDARSRGRKPHPASRARTARHLQTYDAAIAARMITR